MMVIATDSCQEGKICVVSPLYSFDDQFVDHEAFWFMGKDKQAGVGIVLFGGAQFSFFSSPPSL